MSRQDDNTRHLTQQEIRAAFDSGPWAERFPPVLNVEQAAELAGVPVGTIYDWSSREQLSSCAAKRGKRLRIWRDAFVLFLFPTDGEERR